MNCQRTQQLLSMEKDGRPAGKDAGAVMAHVRDCPACRRFQDALAGLGDKVRTAGEWQPAPRREIRSRALDRWFTERESQTADRRRPFFLFFSAPAARPYQWSAVAVVVLAAVGLGWWHRGGKDLVRPPQMVSNDPTHPVGPFALPQGTTPANVRTAPGTRREKHLISGGDQTARLESGDGSSRRALPTQTEQATPGQPSTTTSSPRPVPPVSDPQFLDGRDPSLLSLWNPMDGAEQEQLEKILRKLPPPADNFVRIPFPRIAAGGNAGAAIAAATREYRQKAKVVDTRLFRKVTIQMKGVSFADFCAGLQEQTGVTLHASRGVADEKVTVFVKEQPARDLMRAVARLFGYAWLRSGEEGGFRYELDQDLKSQLAEEELRSQDAHAALLAMDTAMGKYRPYLGLSFEQIEKRWVQDREENRKLGEVCNGGWGGVQLYSRLTSAERAALAAGEELVYRPDASNADRRLPAEWTRSIVRSFRVDPGPDDRIIQLRLRLDRSELGRVSLVVRTIRSWKEKAGEARTYFDQELTVGRSPSVANPENAKANAALRGQSPFDQVVTLRPEPSCATVRRMLRGQEKRLPYGIESAAIGDLRDPHVFSGDVWEAVHRETGLPIVADYYTRMHRLDRVRVSDRNLFEGLCTVGDAMGVRWRKEGDFLLCRSTSYFWDRQKEVPNRNLRRWIADRDAHGELPLSDLLEMASMTDAQLDSAVVREGITHCLGLREWELFRFGSYRWARFLSTLTPEQLRRALSPDRIPLTDLTPEQRRSVMALQYAQYAEADRQSGGKLTVPADWWSHALFGGEYVPAAWYVWTPPERAYREHVFNPIYGRTAAEALAAARRAWSEASTTEVKPMDSGQFSAGIAFFFHN